MAREGWPGVGARPAPSSAGPWARDPHVKNLVVGNIPTQKRNGSCLAACGAEITEGLATEDQLTSEMGEWGDVTWLADCLNEVDPEHDWTAAYHRSPKRAHAAVSSGKVVAVLKALDADLHAVVIDPFDRDKFLVLDPGFGGSYEVDGAWIRKYVVATVVKRPKR